MLQPRVDVFLGHVEVVRAVLTVIRRPRLHRNNTRPSVKGPHTFHLGLGEIYHTFAAAFFKVIVPNRRPTIPRGHVEQRGVEAHAQQAQATVVRVEVHKTRQAHDKPALQPTLEKPALLVQVALEPHRRHVAPTKTGDVVGKKRNPQPAPYNQGSTLKKQHQQRKQRQ